MDYRTYIFPTAQIGDVQIMDGENPADPFQVAGILDDLETNLNALTDLEDLVKVVDFILDLRTKRVNQIETIESLK